MCHRSTHLMRTCVHLMLLLATLTPVESCNASGPQRSLATETEPSLPLLPRWSSFSFKPSLPTPQIKVLRATLSTTTPSPGATFSVTTSFVVTSRIEMDYVLNLSLVDAKGATLAETHSDLDNKSIFLPTTRWMGPVSINLPLTLPDDVSLSTRGTLFLMLSLSNWRGTAMLSHAPDLQQDSQHRICVGAVTIDRSASEAHLRPQDPVDLSHYTLTFSDDFATASISDAAVNDGSRWYSQNERCCLGATDGARTAMAARTGPHNPFLLAPPNGLIIRLERNADLWTSGVLTSVDAKGAGFSQQYGYFEMEARFPAGLNTWPAFWLLNTASKRSSAPAGEIDIVEYIANPAFARYIATTLHDWSDKSTPAMSHHIVDLPSDGFHTYGMLWTADTMTFYFDGAVTFQCPTPAIMHQPYYLLLDLGLGGGWPTKSTPPRNDLEIRRVRVYRQR